MRLHEVLGEKDCKIRRKSWDENVFLVQDAKFTEDDVLADDWEIVKSVETGWERVEIGSTYYYLNNVLKVDNCIDEVDVIDIETHGVGNYFSTKEKAEEMGKMVGLLLRLHRYADECNAKFGEVDWYNGDQKKWFIYVDYRDKSITYVDSCRIGDVFNVCFLNEHDCMKAIVIFGDEIKSLCGLNN